MRVAVVSPYFKESVEWLRQCHESVRSQTYPCTHIMIADGFGRDEIDDWPVQHIRLSCSHGEGGDFPRSTGALSAIRQGFDAVAYLDADNWLYPDHVEHMVHLHKSTSAPISVAQRTFRRLDGERLNRTDPFENMSLYDANCVFLTKESFFIARIWAALPAELGCISDRIVSLAIRQHKLAVIRGDHPTVECRTGYIEDYVAAGERPPAEAKNSSAIGRANSVWKDLTDADKARILGLQMR